VIYLMISFDYFIYRFINLLLVNSYLIIYVT